MTAPKNFLAVAAEHAAGIHYVAEHVADALKEPTPHDFILANPPLPASDESRD